MARKGFFTKETYAFLTELRENNDRDWFNASKERFVQHARDPMSHFITEMQGPLSKLSKSLNADPRPQGGSMFRIYRDTRFSRDKTPYKTHIAAQFRHHDADDVHSIGYYMHIGPDENFAGGGVWMPASDALLKIRRRIAAKPAEWKHAIGNTKFLKLTDGIEGEQLTRVPRGFDADHPLADDLRRKSFVAGSNLTPKQVMSGDLISTVTEIYRAMEPLMAFLAKAQGMNW